MATSHVEGALRLGTVSRFPVMPACYGAAGGGLGWQSMPASFLVEEQNYGFVQWDSRPADGVRRTHPASGFLGGYQTSLTSDELIAAAIRSDEHWL